MHKSEKQHISPAVTLLCACQRIPPGENVGAHLLLVSIKALGVWAGAIKKKGAQVTSPSVVLVKAWEPRMPICAVHCIFFFFFGKT